MNKGWFPKFPPQGKKKIKNKKIIVFVIKGYFKSFYYYLYLYDIYGYYYLI